MSSGGTAARIQYTADFLLTRRSYGSQIDRLVDVNNIIKEHNQCSDEPVSRGRHGFRRGSSTRGWPRQGRGAGARVLEPPAVKVTRMPIKTDRSALTLLLNKLGEDNVTTVADSVLRVFTETEDREELIAWFIEKTLPQTALADIFAGMWLRIFRANAEVKQAYMNACRSIFEGLKYDNTESDNDSILQLAHAIPALNRCNAITFRPVQMLIGRYLDNLQVESGACLHALALMIEATASPTGRYLATYVSSSAFNTRQAAAAHILKCLATTGTHLNIGILIMDAIMMVSNADEDYLETTSNPSQWEAALFVALLQRNKISRGFISEHTGTLVNGIQDRPETIDALLVFLAGCGTWLPASVRDEAVCKAKEIVANASAFNVSMKVRFKFMDLLDLATIAASLHTRFST